LKLWYQSMSRQGAWSDYNKALRRILDAVKDPGTKIDVHGIKKIGGTTPQFHYLDYLETGEVLENVQTAMRKGYDAFLIGNIGDPGLQAAREIADIPVLALGETSAHLACMMGRNFSLVTINEKFTQRIVDNIGRYGMSGRLAAVNRMKVERILHLDAGFRNPKSRRKIIDQFMKAANANIDAGAEVIVPAGGVVMALLADAGIHDAGRGTPILNGITALVKTAEAVVKLNRIMGGRFTSKRLYYAPPGPDQIDEIRKHYGDVYPSVPREGSRSRPAARKRPRKSSGSRS
jgi:Asp/Glu/hydantoin racemase